jgi:hypothetical protein
VVKTLIPVASWALYTKGIFAKPDLSCHKSKDTKENRFSVVSD